MTTDLRPLLLPIRDQGREGACSGFAASAVFAALWRVKHGSALPEWPSPAYLYAKSRMRWGTFPADTGASLYQEFDTLKSCGVCPESMMPYQDWHPAAPVPSGCDEAAAAFRIASFERLVTNDVVSIKQLLSASVVMAFAMPIVPSFMWAFDHRWDGLIPMPDGKETPIGNHALVLCGNDDETGHWVVANSWGTGVGDAKHTNSYPSGPLNLGGFCYLPYGYEKFFTTIYAGHLA